MIKRKKILFSTDSNVVLAKYLIKKLNFTKGAAEIKKFADGEISIHIRENIQYKDVYVLGSTFPPSDNIIKLLLLINTLRANGAKNIIVIIPYFGYGKADHIKEYGDPLSAKFIVQAIKLAGATKAIAINLHSQLVEKFFIIPLINLNTSKLLANEFKKMKVKDLAVVSPDAGGIKKAKKFANLLNIRDVIYLKKFRPSPDRVKIVEIKGQPLGKNLIIVDDMVQTGGTLIKTAAALKERGAKNIYVAITHMIYSAGGWRLLKNNKAIKKIFLTNTIPAPSKLSSKFKVMPVENVLIEFFKK